MKRTLNKIPNPLWFIAGLVLTRLHVFAPIHEFGHLLMSLLWRVDARIVDWNTTQVNGGPLIFVVPAGVVFESMVYAFCTVQLAKHRYRAYYFFLGCMVSVAVFTPQQRDMTIMNNHLGWPFGYLLAAFLFVFVIITYQKTEKIKQEIIAEKKRKKKLLVKKEKLHYY